MFFKIIGYLVVGALMVLLGRLLYEKIVYIKKPIKTVYGEITYDNPARIVVYDFSKFEKDGIVGVIYHSDIKRQDLEDEIRMGTLKKMEKESPEFSSKELMGGLAKMKIAIPHFYIMKNATLLINRFTKEQIVEGEIERWTQ